MQNERAACRQSRPAAISRAEAERILTAYAASMAGRDDMIRMALAAGFTKHRIHVLSGIARTTIDRVVRGEEAVH